MTEYSPPAGNRLGAALLDAFPGFDGNRLRADLGAEIVPPEPTGITTALSVAIRHRDSVPKGLQAALAYGQAVPFDRRSAFRHQNTEPRNSQSAIRWRQTLERGQSRAIAHRFGLPMAGESSLRWRNLRPRNAERASPWKNTAPLDVGRSVEWRNARRADRRFGQGWHDTEIQDVGLVAPWNNAIRRPRHYAIPWGATVQPPTLWKNPEIFEPVEPTPPGDPVYVPPLGNRLGAHLNCLYTPPQGNRLKAHLRRLACLRRHYVIDNDLIIRRADNEQEVTADSVSLSGNLESFAFSFSASVPRESGLELIDPAGASVEIEIIINGITFLCLVESFGDDRSWSEGRQDSISVQGRSVSAELDEPYTLPRSRAETESLTVVQLMQQELPEGGPWSLEIHPGFVDFTVPGGTFAYSGLTPIRAIAYIAGEVGAVVIPDTASRTLRIVPRFVARPWRIGDAESDTEIEYGLVEADRRRWYANIETQPRLGVFVEGEKNGVAVSARVDGTAGEWAEPVVSQLITDAQAGLARAIAEMGQSWIAAEVDLQLPLATEGEGMPGLVSPGQVVTVTESVSSEWKGISTAWAIAARWSDNDGLTIDQRVTIERYQTL